MKILFLTLFAVCFHPNVEPTLRELRSCYRQAVTQKSAAEKFDQLLATVDTGAAPVLLGYKGACEMIQAKYALNPIAKLFKFRKGKSLLELAVSRDTLNLETRFLRFSIQSNIPALLNYKDEMIKDKCFLMNHAGSSKDQELKEMILNYFVVTNTLTEVKIKKIKN
jgi:hypothetical protein